LENHAGPEEFRAFYEVFWDRPEPENCTTLAGGSAAGIVQYPDFSFRRENELPGAETVPVFWETMPARHRNRGIRGLTGLI